MVKFYGYAKCSTCRKAKKYLKQNNVDFDDIDIASHPPPKSVLQAILRSGEYNIGRMFNRSGQMYRELNMKDKIKGLPQAQLLELLAKNGKLIKRPIVIGKKGFVVGFDEAKLKSII